MPPCYDFQCDTCTELWDETRPMAESDAPSTCPACGAAGRRAWRTCPPARMVDVSGFHPGLARFPGDPLAHVEGKHSLNKLVDEKKREGRTVLDNT